MRLHAVADERERMAVAERRAAAGQRDVDGAGGTRVLRGAAPGRPSSVLRSACFSSLAQRPMAFFSSGVRGRDQLHPGGDDAVLAAEVPVADGLRVPGGRACAELRLERGDLRGRRRPDRGDSSGGQYITKTRRARRDFSSASCPA